MWKDSYKIGVSKIDEQHKELFRVTGELIRALNEKESDETKKDCIEAVTFLKSYALEHFADEERYQAEINFPNINEHKKLHKKFVQTVLAHEKKMQDAGFSIASIKDFTGMLVAWLIYHVADEDQKIVKETALEDTYVGKTILEVFQACTCDVLYTTAGLKDNEIKKVQTPEKGIKGDISFVQSFAGDIIGDVTFVFTKPLALQLFEIMTTIKLMVIDTMVVASLTEIMEIIGEKAVNLLSKNGINCSIVAVDMISEATTFIGEKSLGLYSLIGNMGIHDECIHK